MTILTRFWKKVDKTSHPNGCWVWIGKKDLYGYGRFYINYRLHSAHRLSYAFAKGEIEDPKLKVCHHCDNPACVNPDHLFLGTHSDNMRDMHRKGRGTRNGRPPTGRGEDNPASKISLAQAEEIRQLKSQGVDWRTLSQQFGISKAQIYRISSGKHWK